MMVLSGTSFGQAFTGSKTWPIYIQFRPNSSTLLPTVSGQLNTVANLMNTNSNKITVSAGSGGSKLDQQRSWERVNNVINYLSQSGKVNRNRFIFDYQGAAPVNMVVLRPATANDRGPMNAPPPQPSIRKY